MAFAFRPTPLKTPLRLEIVSLQELRAFQEGLRIYTRNMTAAQGTAKGLGDSDVVERWAQEVEWLESKVLPKVQEQQALGLSPIEQEIADADEVQLRDRTAQHAPAPSKAEAAENEAWDQGPLHRAGSVAHAADPVVVIDDPDAGPDPTDPPQPSANGPRRLQHRKKSGPGRTG